MQRKNILISTVGSAGDILPMLGLGAELKRRGHEITVLYMPVLEDEIRRAGFDYIPIGTMEDIQDAMNDPDLWHPVRALEVIARKAILRYMRPIYEEIARFDPERTLLLTSGLAFGGRLAQEKLGHRLVTVHLQSSILMSAHDNPELAGYKLPERLPVGLRQRYLSFIEKVTVDRLIAPGLNAFRKELGLPPVRKIFSRWIHSPEGVIGLFPAWFAPIQPDWPAGMVQTGFVKYEQGFQEMPPKVEDFLKSGTAPIIFTAGSANVHGEGFFRTAIETTRRLNRRAVLLSRYPEQIPPDLPDGVIHADWVPMSRLLPRAALLVHHGGIGTTAQGLAAGIPQLITPLAHDQFDNADRLRKIGVGDRLLPRQFTMKKAVPVMERLLSDPMVHEQAQIYAARTDFDAAVRATGDIVESFLSD